MISTECTLRNSGWLDPCQDGIPELEVSQPVKLSVEQSSKEWKEVVTNKRNEILSNRNKDLPVKNTSKYYNNFVPNEVKVVDKDYLDRIFDGNQQHSVKIIGDTIHKFNLNTEQERAFQIVTNHGIINNPKPLKMYMGGMAGTGKTQVIKALMHFFAERKEEYRFLVLAPTGAAAALMNRSTYHSVLGICDAMLSSFKSA